MKKIILKILFLLILSAILNHSWGNSSSHENLPFSLELLHEHGINNFSFFDTDNDGWDEFLYTYRDGHGNTSLRVFKEFFLSQFQDNEFKENIDRLFPPFVFLNEKKEIIYITPFIKGFTGYLHINKESGGQHLRNDYEIATGIDNNKTISGTAAFCVLEPPTSTRTAILIYWLKF